MAAVIPNRHNMSIDGATFMKGVAPIGTGMNVLAGVNGDVTLDQVHDEIFESTKGKPSAWEDQILLSTTINTDSNTKILSTISSMGKCVKLHDPRVLGAQTQPNEGLIPYTIPDNRVACYIRDCFSGTGIPGLNNIFDQATMSLKSFIEYHNRAVVGAAVFGNPLAGYGGLGQQLYAPPAADAKLKYTAYFNYDLLMFVYITRIILQPNGPQTLIDLRTKVINAINGPAVLLTPAEIETINIININYLWCKLMIYCVESLRSDSFLTGSLDEYLPAMNKLTQIRFESFAKNGDNYFTNPIFGYRGNNPVDITQNVTPETLTYIDSLCTAVYTADADPGFGSQMNNSGLSGGVQYVTTQSMVAQAMTKAISKRAGIIARNANNKDPIQNACANEIDKLFKYGHAGISAVSAVPAPDRIARGWSMIKFSGDSSHVVFGEIMEAIQISASDGATSLADFASGLTAANSAAWAAVGNTAVWAAANGASAESVFYLILVPNGEGRFKFKIVYLIEERPLTARLLAAEKNIFVEGTKLIMDTFTGFGSDDKYDRHAALYIEFDMTSSYLNILTGVQDKIKKYMANRDKYTNARQFLEMDVAQRLAELPISDLDNAGVFLLTLIAEPAPADGITQDFLRLLARRIANWPFIINFDLDTILIKLSKLLDADKDPNYILLADTLVGKGFPRISRATNWKALMIVMQTTYIGGADGSQSSGTQNGYYDMKEILSIISKLYSVPQNVANANAFMERLLTNTEGLLKVLNKMVSSFESVRTIADIFSRDKIAKYNAFTQDRIAEWMQDKSGESPPSKIELMVNGLKEFVDLSLDVRAKYKENGGSGDIRLLGGGMDNNDGFMIGGELSEEFKAAVIASAELKKTIASSRDESTQAEVDVHKVTVISAIVTEFAKYSHMIIAPIQIDGLISGDNKLVSNDNGLITRNQYITNFVLPEEMTDANITETEKFEKIIKSQVTQTTGEDINRNAYNIVFDAINILDSIRERPLNESNELYILEILNFSVEDIISFGESELIRYEQIRRIVGTNLVPVFVDILARESAVYETYDQHKTNLTEMINIMFEIHNKVVNIDADNFNKKMLDELGIQIRKGNTPPTNLLTLYNFTYDASDINLKKVLPLLYEGFNWISSEGVSYYVSTDKINWINNVKQTILKYITLVGGIQYGHMKKSKFVLDLEFIDILVYANYIREFDNMNVSRIRNYNSMVLRNIGLFNTFETTIRNNGLSLGGKNSRINGSIRTKITKKRRYVIKTSPRKKTKRSNRTKKNKTRRKRNY